MTTNRKLVPQRGWKVVNFCAFSTLTGLPGFEIEDHFMLRAVIFEHAADVLHARKNEQEDEEDQHADDAVGQVEGNAPARAPG